MPPRTRDCTSCLTGQSSQKTFIRYDSFWYGNKINVQLLGEKWTVLVVVTDTGIKELGNWYGLFWMGLNYGSEMADETGVLQTKLCLCTKCDVQVTLPWRLRYRGQGFCFGLSFKVRKNPYLSSTFSQGRKLCLLNLFFPTPPPPSSGSY